MKYSAALFIILNSLQSIEGNENGLARSPPLGWRSWNLFGGNVNQDLIQGIMKGMADRSRTVNGVQTSLIDLGYSDVGLDDNWQVCTDGHYHDDQGRPVVNTTIFPSMKNMTDYAHSLGLTAGFYGNNCICSDASIGDKKFYQGDVDAFVEFGFDSWKLDGCGAQTDLELWDQLLSAAGKKVVVENCHWGSREPYEPEIRDGNLWCPWNFYRTSGDISAHYDSIMSNLETVTKYAENNLSVPGCWAYPDMLEVGVGDLSFNEWRTHFAAWAIVSSPLILSHDVNDQALMNTIWPIISNTEVIAVNQKYVDMSGQKFFQSNAKVKLGKNWAAQRTDEIEVLDDLHLSEQVFYFKNLGDDGIAILLINNAEKSASISLDLKTVPGVSCSSSCALRDIYEHKDLGNFDLADKSVFTQQVESHDSLFLVITNEE